MNVIELLRSLVRTASAHCDTEDGPAVVDGGAPWRPATSTSR